jgi:hypothetical protein
MTLTIKEVNWREERIVEVRHLTTESHKRLTANSATRILHREIPNLPTLVRASKSTEAKGVFFAMHAAMRDEKCSFHYTWRHYYLSEDST